MLGPLQDNGGPTLTHALLPGSPAIDMGDPTSPRHLSSTSAGLDLFAYSTVASTSDRLRCNQRRHQQPTVTATPTATRRPQQLSDADTHSDPTATATATATATPTSTPRPSPTPRPQLTPRPRPHAATAPVTIYENKTHCSIRLV